jgi:hypothetical protein
LCEESAITMGEGMGGVCWCFEGRQVMRQVMEGGQLAGKVITEVRIARGQVDGGHPRSHALLQVALTNENIAEGGKSLHMSRSEDQGFAQRRLRLPCLVQSTVATAQELPPRNVGLGAVWLEAQRLIEQMACLLQVPEPACLLQVPKPAAIHPLISMPL